MRKNNLEIRILPNYSVTRLRSKNDPFLIWFLFIMIYRYNVKETTYNSVEENRR